MKEVEKTIGKLIDHQKIAFIGSIDVDGYPNMKAMLTPRKREGIRTLFFSRGDVERYDGSING